MKKSIKIISAFLGMSMLVFGVLKFINPFKGWYASQVLYSQLPFSDFSYWSGQIGEIVVGLLLLAFSLTKLGANDKKLDILFLVANFSIIAMMLVAFYVHNHPDVPANVLPLKIKPPVIPAFFLILGAINIFLKFRPDKTK